MMRYARHDHLGLTNDIINDFKEIQQVFMCWLYNVIYIYIRQMPGFCPDPQ